MGVRLPPEYQEVEYLESTYLDGAQTYIDTGILITDDLIFEIDFQAALQNTAKYFMGRYQNNEFYLYRSAKAYFQVEYNSTWKDTTVVVDGKRHKFTFQIVDGRVIVTENEVVILSTAKTGSPSNSILIVGTTDVQAASCKTFESKMTKSGVVIQDLIPCYRKVDDKPGMYDLVTETFLVNQGTGEDFTVGPDVIDSISPWLFARRRLLMQKKTARLPAEYQEVEYLETSQTGAPYIDSGVAITEDLVFEIDFQLLDAVRAHYFMGAYSGSDFYLYTSGETTPFFQTAFGSAWANTTLLVDTQRHKFVYQFENEKLVVRDSNTTILTKPKAGFTNHPILVAGTSHSQSMRIPCRTYESKMTKSGVVIQDLIPCYRKVDDTPGMYDLVSNTFFTNAGTGEFIVGADIN